VVVPGVMFGRGGCAQENGHFDRLSAGRLLFQSAVERARSGSRLTGWFLQVLVRTVAAEDGRLGGSVESNLCWKITFEEDIESK